MKSKFKTAFISLCIGASLSAGSAFAAPSYEFAKPETGVDQTIVDNRACSDEAASAMATARTVTPSSVNPYVVLGGAIMNGLYAGYERGKARDEAFLNCMRGRGYGRIELTPSEAAAAQAAKSPAEKQAWLDTFLSSDLSSRIARALKAPPTINRLSPKPFEIAALKIDENSLRLADKPVAVGDVILTGTATHRLTGTISQGPSTDIVVPVGAPYHYMEITTPNSGGGYWTQTWWCGPLHHSGFLNRVVCLSPKDADHFYMKSDYGADWLVYPKQGSNDPDVESGYFSIKESESDLIGPMHIQMLLRDVKTDSVDLEIRAEQSGKWVKAWAGRAPMSSKGEVIIPFWNRSLLLQQNPSNFVASFEAAGGDQGPVEAGLTLSK